MFKIPEVSGNIADKVPVAAAIQNQLNSRFGLRREGSHVGGENIQIG